MSIDFRRSTWERLLDLPITADIVEEGQLAVEAAASTVSEINFLEGTNQQAAAISAAAANERPLGVFVSDKLAVTTTTVVETGTIPAVSPYTIQLKHGTIENNSVMVYDETDAGVQAENCPTPGNNQFCTNDTTGVVTFNSADAGHDVTIQYRRALTAAEAIQLFGDRNVNNKAQDQFRHASIAAGYCRIFTTQYDSSLRYTLDLLLEAGATGRFAPTGTGSGQNFGHVFSVPTVDDPYLGVEYDTGSVTSIATP